MNQTFTQEQLLTRWEWRREIQNIMGKVSQSYVMMEEAQIYERFWSGRDDVCLGVNEGWYSGKDAVKGYYDALGEKIRLASDIIAKAFPEKLSGKSPEELDGEELRAAVRFACAAAGLSCERSGGIQSVPEYAEVIARM